MKNAGLYSFALGFLIIGWLARRNRREELDVVARLRLAGAL